MTNAQAQTLTHKQIDEMPAGREMDQIIAENIMGLDGNGVMWTAGIPPRPCYPRYSTSLVDAWQVAKRISSGIKCNVDLDCAIYGRFVTEFEFQLKAATWQDISGSTLSWLLLTPLELHPICICRAALKAILDK